VHAWATHEILLVALPVAWLLGPAPVSTARHVLLLVVTRPFHHLPAHHGPLGVLAKGILLLIAPHARVVQTPLVLLLDELFVIQAATVCPHLRATVQVLPSKVSLRVHEWRCLEATAHVDLCNHRLHALVVGKSVAQLHLVTIKATHLV
jgi:hypothetical protein